MNSLNFPHDWILLPPSGRLAIYRYPSPVVPTGCRIATGVELLAANRGNPFPWGNLPEPHPHNRQWREHRLGVGGLVHSAWFVTTDGRFGGAPNVPERRPGSLRSCLYLDGGGSSMTGILSENEGYAVVTETTAADEALFRRVTLFAAEHVMADGGAIIVSPVSQSGVVMTGFVGRCQICPNAELISFPQLQVAIKEYPFELWSEWRDWSVGPVNRTHDIQRSNS